MYHSTICCRLESDGNTTRSIHWTVEDNNNYHKAVSCCNAMLEKWLDVDAKATWEKLLRVIESHAVSTGQIFNTKGIHRLAQLLL